MLRLITFLAIGVMTSAPFLKAAFGSWTTLTMLNNTLGFGFGNGLLSNWGELAVHEGTTNPVGQIIMVAGRLFPAMQVHYLKVYKVNEDEALQIQAMADTLKLSLIEIGKQATEDARTRVLELSIASAKALSLYLTMIPKTRVREIS